MATLNCFDVRVRQVPRFSDHAQTKAKHTRCIWAAIWYCHANWNFIEQGLSSGNNQSSMTDQVLLVRVVS